MKDFLQCVVPTLGLDQATVRTINYFCAHLEDMICKVWTPPNVRSGYIKAGLLANTPTGIDIDVILGHWLGMAQMRQEHYDIIRGSIPIVADESLRNTTVSDASMACLEQYFPRPFKNTTKVDRALMAWSRMRAAILVADKSKHLRNWQIVAAVVPAGGTGGDDDSVDPPLSHGYMQSANKKGEKGDMMRVCGCRAEAFKNARLYPNTALGWKSHQKGAPHRNWLLSKQNKPSELAADGQQPDAAAAGKLFSDHPFAQQPNASFLASVASTLCLHFDVAARFHVLGFNDEDVVVLSLLRTELYYTMFGMTYANAKGFSDACTVEAQRVLGMVPDEEELNVD